MAPERMRESEGREEKPKIKKVIEGANDLSLGISMVVAVLIGVALGYWMRKLFGYEWLFWLGVFWGVAGAVLNVYKAYKKQMRSLEELKNDPRYRSYRDFDDEEDDS
ncbi:AtpZ/AtpI family protein [Hydrogenimonas sp. SS33]|uniref:AtpZ/AtpI family protein n=1 Tax=Hydrogenimonas leucolamina TaxID=2954236 RepID=UPI00336C22FE